MSDITDQLVFMLEIENVHKFYNEIVEHFSETPDGAVLLDISWGNGKYLGNACSKLEL